MLNQLTAKLGRKPHHQLTERQRRIHDFLSSNPVGVLSSVTPDNNPHGVVIYFSLDHDFNIFFVTKSYTHKYDNLKHHDHVMLTVFEPVSQTTAQVIGNASEITDPTTLNGIAAAILGSSLKTSIAGLPPISKLEAGPYVAFQIKPVQIRMAVYARPDPGDYSHLFESLESFELELN